MFKIRPYHIMCMIIVMVSGLSIAQESTSQETFSGVIEGGDNYFQEFELEITAISDVTLDMRQGEGSDLDTLIKLVDRNNLVIEENDDRNDNDRTSLLTVKHLQPGDYRIVATRFDEAEGDTTGAFDIEVTINPIEAPAPYAIDDNDLDNNGFPALEPREKASWTILAYYGADTNLEKDVINDFNEFELAGGSDENVRIIALMDRTPGHNTSNGDWSNARLYEIAADKSGDEASYPADAPTIDTVTLTELGEVDTGAGETLARFLIWGVTTFPADHYAVAFSSHGAAWKGIISDESDNYSSLSVPELHLAFEQGLEAAGIERFDLLINDACLMSSVEYYAEMSNFFNRSLGSPEIVVSPALDMSILARTLKADPNADLNSLGRELIDTYINEDSVEFGGGNAAYYTGVVTDMTRFDNLVDAVNDFAALINQQPARYASLIGQARRNTYTYAAFMGFKTEIDLGDFMEQLLSLTEDEDLRARANNVLETLDNVNIHANAGAIALERSSYYSIYFPAVVNDFEARYYDDTPLQEWGQMLRSYYTYAAFNFWRGAGDALTFHAPAAPAVTITNIFPDEANFNLPIAIDMEVVGNDIARGFFTIDRVLDDNQSVRLLQQPMLRDVVTEDGTGVLKNQNIWLPGVDSRSFKWAATAYQVSDGANTNFEFLQQSLDGEETFFLGGRYRNADDADWEEVRVVFAVDSEKEFDLRLTSIVSVGEGGSTAVIQPEVDAQFQAFQTVIDDEGDQQFDLSGTYTLSEMGLVANEMPVASGDYIVSFEIQNFGGQIARASRPVIVNNDDIDITLRGQNFATEAGFISVAPAEWSDFVTENTYIYSNTFTLDTSPDNPYPSSGILFNILDNENASEDPDASRQTLEAAIIDSITVFSGIADSPQDIVFDEAPLVIDEYEGISYQLTTEGGNDGRGFALYLAPANKIYVMLVYDKSADENYADDLYEVIFESTSFYTSGNTGLNAARWTRKQMGDEVEFPYPVAWDDEPVEENDWLTYRPESDSLVQAAFQVFDNAEIDVSQLLSFVIPDATDAQEPTTFISQSASWDVIEYNTIQDDVDIAGRLYLTEKSERLYAIRVEAPQTEAADIFPQTLEPLVSGFSIADRFYIEDYSDEIGVILYRPGPRMPGNTWNRRLYDSEQQLVYADNFAADERVEMYLFPELTMTSPSELAQMLTERFEGSEINGDVALTFVDTREVAEFDITYRTELAEWSGRYFATYDEERQLGLIIGVRAIEERGDFETHYNNIKRFMTFTPGAYYPYRPITEYFVYDENSGFTVDFPSLWQTPGIERNSFPSGDQYVVNAAGTVIARWVSDTPSELEAQYEAFLGSFFEPDERGLQTVTIDGYPALEVHGGFATFEGAFFFVYEEARARTYITGYLVDGGGYETIYNALRSSFDILEAPGAE